MAFNHNTSWEAYALSKSLHDLGDDLLQELRNVRQKVEVRHNSWRRHRKYVHYRVLTLLRNRPGLSYSSVTASED